MFNKCMLKKETLEKWLKILYFPLHNSQNYKEGKRRAKESSVHIIYQILGMLAKNVLKYLK